MSVPVLSSSSPADGSTQVSPETEITLTFNTDIDSTSVNPGTVTLYRSDTYDPVRVNLAVSGNVIQITPESALMDNMGYRVFLSGDSANPAGVIESATGDALAQNEEINFRTGTERFVSKEEILERTDIGGIGPIRVCDPLAAQPATGSLELMSVTPAAYAYDVSVDTSQIVFQFNQPLDPTTLSGITVTQKNVFYMDNMYAEDEDADGVVDFDPDSEDNTPPSGSLAVSDDQVIWSREAAQSFLHNTLVQIQVGTTLQGASGATLLEAYSGYFLTKVFPEFIGVGLIRAEMGLSVSTLTDATIALLIHKNSIEVWEGLGRKFTITEPKYAHREWVKCKTVIDIINVLTLATQLSQGQTKTLGDFSLQIRPTDPTLMYKLKQVLECLEKIERRLNALNIAKAAVKGINNTSEKGSYRYRTWDRFYLRRTPIVGTPEDREEILDLDFDYTLADKSSSVKDRYNYY